MRLKYRIIVGYTISQLQNLVDNLCIEGWIPVGGIVITEGDIPGTKEYIQAMTL